MFHGEKSLLLWHVTFIYSKLTRRTERGREYRSTISIVLKDLYAREDFNRR